MPSETGADSFGAFYGAAAVRVVRHCYALTGSLADAQDIAQEAFARAWQRWASVSRCDSPEAWVRKVATNLAVGSWRRDRAARAVARELAGEQVTSTTRWPQPGDQCQRVRPDLARDSNSGVTDGACWARRTHSVISSGSTSRSKSSRLRTARVVDSTSSTVRLSRSAVTSASDERDGLRLAAAGSRGRRIGPRWPRAGGVGSAGRRRRRSRCCSPGSARASLLGRSGLPRR